MTVAASSCSRCIPLPESDSSTSRKSSSNSFHEQLRHGRSLPAEILRTTQNLVHLSRHTAKTRPSCLISSKMLRSQVLGSDGRNRGMRELDGGNRLLKNLQLHTWICPTTYNSEVSVFKEPSVFRVRSDCPGFAYRILPSSAHLSTVNSSSSILAARSVHSFWPL